MRRSVIALFILILPLLEIAGFVVVGSRIGALATVGLVIASGVLGSVLLRIQGMSALRRAQIEAQAGGAPDREIVHGAMIMLAGLLLIIPGFITDIIGLLLFIPAVRDIAWNAIRSRIIIVGNRGGTAAAGRGGRQTKVIDLDEQDYREVDENGSPWRKTGPE
jgi:UPF0716 protein FxsA